MLFSHIYKLYLPKGVMFFKPLSFGLLDSPDDGRYNKFLIVE